MSGGFPVLPAYANFSALGVSTSTTLGTAIVSGAANTKGSFTQIVSSAPSDISWLFITVYNATNNGGSHALDIAVGGSGSEQVIVSDIVFAAQTFWGCTFAIPVSIPAGTRISARLASSSATQTLNVGMVAADAAAWAGGAAPPFTDVYGFQSSLTIGTLIDPGGTANTKGSFTQLSASITNDLAGFLLCFDNTDQNNETTGTWLFDIAVGAAAAEQVLIPNILVFRNSTASNGSGMAPKIFWVEVPAGTRLSARCQSTLTSNTFTIRQLGVTLIGIRK